MDPVTYLPPDVSTSVIMPLLPTHQHQQGGQLDKGQAMYLGTHGGHNLVPAIQLTTSVLLPEGQELLLCGSLMVRDACMLAADLQQMPQILLESLCKAAAPPSATQAETWLRPRVEKRICWGCQAFDVISCAGCPLRLRLQYAPTVAAPTLLTCRSAATTTNSTLQRSPGLAWCQRL